MALFIKFAGVEGECKDSQHTGWSDLLSMSWGLHRPGGGTTGVQSRTGTATVDDIVISKAFDKASPKLAEMVLSGKVFPKVEIHNTATFGANRCVYLKYVLENVAVTSHNVGATNDDTVPPHESFSLNFQKVTKTYTEYDANGSKKGNVEMTWNVEAGTK